MWGDVLELCELINSNMRVDEKIAPHDVIELLKMVRGMRV